MKTFLSFIGVLTMAQWLFIILLHAFLTVQDKRSPETLARLHDTPVVGGYFPAVDLEGDEDRERERDAEKLRRIVEAKKYYELPEAFSEEELQKLIGEIRERRDELDRQNLEIEERRQEVLRLVADFERRETELLANQTALEKSVASLEKERAVVDAARRIADEEVDAIETANLKKVAGWMNGIEPGKTARLLVPEAVAGESIEKRRARYADAAKILSLMDVEVAAQVIAEIDPLEWLEIEKEKRKLPIAKK